MSQSYIVDLPSRVLGSLGQVKQVAALQFGRLKRIANDEWNNLCDNVVLLAQTVGERGSTDINSHEWRLNDLRISGYYDDFVTRAGVMAFVTDWPGGAAGVDDTSFANAIGVKSHTTVAGNEAGLSGDVMWFDLRNSRFITRIQIDAAPAGVPDFIAAGLFNLPAGNDWVAVVVDDPSNPVSSLRCEICVGGAVTAMDVFNATGLDLVGAFKTIEIETTAAGAVFTYQRGETDESVVTLTAAPANLKCNGKATMRSAAGGEVLSNDRMGVRDTRTALIKP